MAKQLLFGDEARRKILDGVSQLALAIPMCLLYEIGIWAAQVFIKHTQAPTEPPATPSA